MKKALLLFSLVWATMSFAGNPVSERVKSIEQRCKELTSKYDTRKSGNVSLELNGMKKHRIVMPAKTVAVQEKQNDRTGFELVKSFVQKAQEQTKLRLDSCIVRDKDDKIFAKDYYYYYPADKYGGALRAIELYQLDEVTNEWSGYRQSAEYDRFGNANIRLIETQHEGVWGPVEKYIAEYTAREGELTLDETYYYEQGEWIGNAKKVTTFDNQNRKLEDMNYAWNPVTKQWADYQKVTMIYETGKTTELTTEWNDTQWVNVSKMETTVNGNGQVTSMMIAEWSLEDNAWNTTMKVDHIYDAEGREIENMSYGFYVDRLNPENKTVYSYDGNSTIQEFYSYDLFSSTWNPQSKHVEVVEDGLLMESINYAANPVDDTWMGDIRTAYKYNATGAVIQVLNQVWVGTQWLDDSKSEIEYNQYGYESHTVNYIFDTDQWVRNSELITETDQEGRVLLLEGYQTNSETGTWDGVGYKEIHAFDENGLGLYDKIYQWTEDGWELYEFALNFYNDPNSTGMNVLNGNSPLVLSSKGMITIQNGQGKNVNVYTSNGMLIRNARITNDNYNFYLDKGIYLLNINGRSSKINLE